MCGIVGLAGTILSKEREAFENMLIFSQVRGPHSTGVAGVKYSDNSMDVVKVVGRPDALIDWNKKYDRVASCDKHFLLGHNRWATQGNVTARNAHPFMFDNIVGCHNGTIHSVDIKRMTGKDTDHRLTDSEQVLEALDTKTVKEVFDKADGAWCFVWYDTRNSTINMLRNKERSMYYAYDKERKCIFWASERQFIDAALQRKGIEYDKVYILKEDRHYVWDMPEQGKTFSEPTQTEVVSTVNFPVPTGGTGSGVSGKWKFQGGHMVNQDDDSRLKLEHPHLYAQLVREREKFQSVKTKPNEPVQDFSQFKQLDVDGQGYIGKKHYRGYRGEKLNKHEFEELTKQGCGWCDAPSQWGQPVRFISPKDHICLVCNDDSSVQAIYGGSR